MCMCRHFDIIREYDIRSYVIPSTRKSVKLGFRFPKCQINHIIRHPIIKHRNEEKMAHRIPNALESQKPPNSLINSDNLVPSSSLPAHPRNASSDAGIPESPFEKLLSAMIRCLPAARSFLTVHVCSR